MDLLIFEIKNIFLPETIIIIAALFNILLSLFFGKNAYKFSERLTLVSIIISLASLSFGISHCGYTIFSENFIQTNFTIIMKVLILLGAIFTVLLSQNISKKLKNQAFEYHSILLISIFASMCLVSSNDFIPLFISLEILSVTSSLLIAFWNKYKPKEAALKFIINSAVATGFLLLGISYMYGISGELNFSLLNINYYSQDTSLLFGISSVLIIIGLTCQLGCMPFQRFVPDIYQGSPYPIAAYLSVVPKLAGFGILARIIGTLMYDTPILQFVISFAALYTIAYGLIGGIRQTDIKRFLAYSSVSHCGFMLLSLSIFSNYGVSSFIYYALVYLFMNFGVWAAAIIFVNCSGTDNIKDYRGIFYIRPYYTVAFLICLISLAGLPPSSGFLSKLYLFIALTRLDVSGLPILIPASLLTVIAVFLYFNIISLMFDRTPKNNCIIPAQHMNTKIVVYFCTLMILLTFFFANKIIALSMFASIGI